MSKARDDILKKIDATVKRKKELSKQVAHQKTIAQWVSDFFVEYQKMNKVDQSNSFIHLAVSHLTIQLRSLDRQCSVAFEEPLNGDPIIKICWSSRYIQDNNCEEVLVFDASSAFFQSAIEQI